MTWFRNWCAILYLFVRFSLRSAWQRPNKVLLVIGGMALGATCMLMILVVFNGITPLVALL